MKIVLDIRAKNNYLVTLYYITYGKAILRFNTPSAHSDELEIKFWRMHKTAAFERKMSTKYRDKMLYITYTTICYTEAYKFKW